MAKDVITRFKLETTQYDSALRTAAKGLSDYAKTASNAGKDFDKFTKDQANAARAFGNIATSSTNAKDQVKELVGAFNEAAKAYNVLSKEQQQSDWGKAMSQSLQQLQQRIKETKQEMQGLGNQMKGSSIFGEDGFKGMMQVFGGNLLTKGVAMAANMAGEIAEIVNQSGELARQAEGIQIAFDRLNNPGLLDNLREATHGTVTDLELMKAAVKFNDFKLPLEELGTMLAFAQQKAKDTGQSVDYMVDSIVTGLGRKSLMILDNLGLSASEVKDKMAETGDMTKAVGEIIRQQMQKAGDYVETAADRSTQANVELENAMLELGQAMKETFGFTGWHDLAVGIKTELVNAIIYTIDWVNDAKKAFQDLINLKNEIMGSAGAGLKNPPKGRPAPPPTDGTYYETTDSEGNVIASGNYLNGKQVQTGTGVVITGTKRDKPTPKGGRSGGKTSVQQQTEYQQNQKKINDLIQQYVALNASGAADIEKQNEALRNQIKELEERNGKLKLYEANARGLLLAPDTKMPEHVAGIGMPLDTKKFTGLSDKAQKALSEQISKQLKNFRKENGKPEEKSFVEVADQINGGVSQMVSSLEQIGIDIPDGFKSVLGSLSGVIGLMQSIITVVEGAKAISTIGSFLGSIFKLSTGGVIRAASGVNVVPGNTTGFDGVPALLQSGEVVLNRSQVNNLANMLEGGGMQNLRLEAVVTGEQIRFALNNNGRRTGRGEYVQSNRR